MRNKLDTPHNNGSPTLGNMHVIWRVGNTRNVTRHGNFGDVFEEV